jgi:DNA-binding SARP family transcriptional activator
MRQLMFHDVAMNGSDLPGRFRFQLLGPFTVWRDGTPLPDREVGSRKGRTLLKLLVLERGHVVAPERIAEILWGDPPPTRWDRDVATLVSRLRAVLGPEAIGGGRTGYRLVPQARFEVDLEEAELLVAEAEARLAAGEPAVARAAAGRALDLCGNGSLLEEDPYAEWAEEARAAAAGVHRRARRSAYRAALDLHDIEEAANLAEAAIAADPLDEDAYRALMLAQQQAGRQGQALGAYERLREVLANELGADPSPESQAVHVAILREEASEPLTGPPVPPRLPEPLDPAFVGRESELGVLSRAWSDAVAGRPALVLVAGEAGIGKTRLAAEAVRLATSTGGLVLRARCYEAERSLFLQPLVDAIRPVVLSTRPDVLRGVVGPWAGPLGELIPEVGHILRPIAYERATPEIERRRSFDAISAFIRSLAESQPVLLFLDDLHNTGSSSLELLHFLMQRAAPARLLVLGTLRIEEGEEALTYLSGVGRSLELGPLPEAAVTELAQAAGAADRASSILARTRGHPLFVIETLRAMTERGPSTEAAALPDSLMAAVLERVRRTGSPVEEVLRVAAILGSTFEPAIAAPMLGIPIEVAGRRIEAARRARLLREAGREFEFANDLIREILYRTTPLPTRIARHRRAAALLGENPEAVAAHAAAAEDWPVAMESWLRAGERAAGRFANRDAERMLDLAFDAARKAGDALGEARARLARGRVREALTDYQGAFEDHSAAAELARSAGDRRIEMLSLKELGGDPLIGMGRQTSETLPYLDEALVIARELGDKRVEVNVLGRLAVTWTSRLRFAEAYDHAHRALVEARELGDEHALTIALDGLKTAAAYSGDLPTLERVVPELETYLRRRGDLWLLQWTVFESSFVPMGRGRWTQAIRDIEAALDLNRRAGYRAYEPMFLAHLGWIHRSTGEYGRALELGREAVALAEDIGHPWWVPIARALLGWTLTEVLALEEAVEHLERGLAAAERHGAESYLLWCLSHLALATWLGGDRDRAMGVLNRAEALLEAITAPPGGAFLHGAHTYVASAQVRLEAGDPTRAHSLVAPVLVAAEAAGCREAFADALLVSGRCELARGRVAEGHGVLSRALAVAEEAGLTRLAWEAHRSLAEADRAAGRSAEARRHARAARATGESMAASIGDEGLRQGFLKGLEVGLRGGHRSGQQTRRS